MTNAVYRFIIVLTLLGCSQTIPQHPSSNAASTSTLGTKETDTQTTVSSSADLKTNSSPESIRSATQASGIPDGATTIEQTVELKIDNDSLYATLELPQTTSPLLVVLLIAGSGPTDRDGNQPILKNDSLKQLAKGLTGQGIATLRYDKRGVGQSVKAARSEILMRFDDQVEDASRWIEWLRSDPRFSKVGIIGHSEGSLIGILTAQRKPVDVLVSVAGAGRPIANLLREQLQSNLPPKLLEQSNRILDILTAEKTTDAVPTELAALFRPSVQPFLISWIKYDPMIELSKLSIPILLVQGTADIQCSTDDQERLASGNKTAESRQISNMNHVLKIVSNLAEQNRTYLDPTIPIAEEVVHVIAQFLKRIPEAR